MQPLCKNPLSLPFHFSLWQLQTAYFQSKVMAFSVFIHNVKVWLQEAGDPYTEQNNTVLDDWVVANLDEVNTADSVSNISSVKPR